MVKIAFTDLDSQLEQAGVSKNSGSKFPESPYLPVGTHSVKIVEVNVKGPNKLDPTWVDVEVTVEGQNNKTRRGYIAAPTTKITYGKFESKNQFYAFKDLSRALGIQQNQLSEKLPDVVEQLLNNPTSVVGASVEVEVGYNATHVKKVNGQWQIVDYKGEPHALFKYATFTDRNAALSAAKLKGVWVQSGPTLTKFKPSATGSGVTVGAPKSAKETVVKKPAKNMPF